MKKGRGTGTRTIVNQFHAFYDRDRAICEEGEKIKLKELLDYCIMQNSIFSLDRKEIFLFGKKYALSFPNVSERDMCERYYR